MYTCTQGKQIYKDSHDYYNIRRLVNTFSPRMYLICKQILCNQEALADFTCSSTTFTCTTYGGILC